MHDTPERPHGAHPDAGRRGEPAADGAERGDASIDEEVRFHIEERTADLMATGLSREEARRRAESAFGDVARVREELRVIGEDMRRREHRREWLSGWGRDVRLGARRLLRSPGHATVAGLTLALGIGATVAMFSVLNAVVLRPLPYPEGERLVQIWPAQNYNITLSREVAAAMPSVGASTGMSQWGLTLAGEGDAAVMQAGVIDAGYFETFGVRPILGRAFTAAETEPSRSGVVLLSHAVWRTRFGADPDVIGRRIRLAGYDHESREVIGVMSPEHSGVVNPLDVWIPLHVQAGATIVTDSTYYVNWLIARLVPGATVEGAAAEIRSVAARLRADHPGRIDEEVAQQATVVSLRDAISGDVHGLLWTLFAAVGLVLLIACGNLSNLLLARAVGQRHVLAVQTSLGATRWRLVRQQLTESGWIAVLGGAAGAALAWVLVSAAGVGEASGLPSVADISPDLRVLGFAMTATLVSLALFGVLPALRASRRLRDPLHATTRGGSRARSSHRLNRVLVAGELALVTVLVTAAGLVLSGFAALRAVDPGMDVDDVLVAQVLPAEDVYTGPRATQYHQELRARLAALPGVTAVGGIHLLPFTISNWAFPYLADGHAPPAGNPLPSANFRIVTPGYFDAVDQAVLSGRVPDETDQAGSQQIVVINHTMAELLWPGEDPVGRGIRIFGNTPYRVVGVVADVHQQALDRDPRPEMYVPQPQWSRYAQMSVMIEGPGVSARVEAVRRVIQSIDPDVPITELGPLADVLGRSVAQRRFVAVTLAAFGLLALVLGGIGVYGVMSHLIGARMPDLGIRMAFGAAARDVLLDSLRTALVPALAGVVVGLLLAFASAELLRGLLFGVPPVHPPSYALATVILLGVALLAGWIPARRASRADPLAVLRAD
ncbi:MAG: ABC transporter permease [Gemmatimonadetes bacterium]|nr:ABC transporter permease [Gemmatimonadota bacterium]